MTNDVFCSRLTRTEVQTLRVLLPATFPIKKQAVRHTIPK